jgi:hypothetical protein
MKVSKCLETLVILRMDESGMVLAKGDSFGKDPEPIKEKHL